MQRIWCQVKRENKLIRHETVEVDAEATARDQIEAALEAACSMMDLPRPMVLPHHARSLAQHGHARFLPDQFVEEVRFDRLELEVLREGRKSDDPRNEA